MFPGKSPQTLGVSVNHSTSSTRFEGATWVAHDWQYHQKILAKKTLDWSVPNTRLYEAFTGWARSIPPCPHCLAKDHGGVNCLHNSNPPILGWFQGSSPIQVTLYSQLQTTPAKPAAILKVCCSFNTNRCWFIAVGIPMCALIVEDRVGLSTVCSNSRCRLGVSHCLGAAFSLDHGSSSPTPICSLQAVQGQSSREFGPWVPKLHLAYTRP